MKNIGGKKAEKHDKKTDEKSSSPKAVDKKSAGTGAKHINEINVSKSTVQVIREKLGDIENLIKRSRAIVKD